MTATIQSVQAQTLQPAAIVIEVDSGRTGAAATRNRALQSVRTPWLAIVDDDDTMLPNHLQVLREAAEETGADLVYSGMDVSGGRDPLAVVVDGQWVNPFGVPFGPDHEHHLRHTGNFIPVTHLARTELVKRVGGFPEPFSDQWPRDCEDWGLLVHLLDAGARFHHAPVRTWRYHFHDANTGGRGLPQPA
jgi:hypothetical protein